MVDRERARVRDVVHQCCGCKLTLLKGDQLEVEKTELEKRVAGIEGMVANLIVDQQAMATSFNARGDRHSGSLCHELAFFTFFSPYFFLIFTILIFPDLILSTLPHSFHTISTAHSNQQITKTRVFKPKT